MTVVASHDCTLCGACCSAGSPRYIPVFGIDEERMDDRALALTWVDDGCRFMRFEAVREGEQPPDVPEREAPEASRCVALRSARDRLICGIYRMRPDACRWLLPGGSLCLQQCSDERRGGAARSKTRTDSP